MAVYDAQSIDQTDRSIRQYSDLDLFFGKKNSDSDIQKITKFDIEANVHDYKLIRTDYIVCRAFKKLDLIFDISREKVKNPHKLIILKGKNALNDLKKLPKDKNYRYKTFDSITDKDSKIIIATKNGK